MRSTRALASPCRIPPVSETEILIGAWPLVQNPNRTILGAPQTQYLKDQLSAAEVGAAGSGELVYKGA